MTAAAVVQFPGSNCDRDMQVAIQAMGLPCARIPHTATAISPSVRLLVLPGGFSFGDALRAGALAARSPLMAALPGWLQGGGVVLGVCNGFQILTEAGLLPGAFAVNRGQRFVCATVGLLAPSRPPQLADWPTGQRLALPIAHREGRYVVEAATAARLEADGQVLLRYQEDVNGAVARIAALCSPDGQVIGMMPHPERAWAPWHDSRDGRRVLLAVARRAGLAVAAQAG